MLTLDPIQQSILAQATTPGTKFTWAGEVFILESR